VLVCCLGYATGKLRKPHRRAGARFSAAVRALAMHGAGGGPPDLRRPHRASVAALLTVSLQSLAR
jgi:hypothetical protein